MLFLNQTFYTNKKQSKHFFEILSTYNVDTKTQSIIKYLSTFCLISCIFCIKLQNIDKHEKNKDTPLKLL